MKWTFCCDFELLLMQVIKAFPVLSFLPTYLATFAADMAANMECDRRAAGVWFEDAHSQLAHIE